MMGECKNVSRYHLAQIVSKPCLDDYPLDIWAREQRRPSWAHIASTDASMQTPWGVAIVVAKASGLDALSSIKGRQKISASGYFCSWGRFQRWPRTRPLFIWYLWMVMGRAQNALDSLSARSIPMSFFPICTTLDYLINVCAGLFLFKCVWELWVQKKWTNYGPERELRHGSKVYQNFWWSEVENTLYVYHAY